MGMSVRRQAALAVDQAGLESVMLSAALIPPDYTLPITNSVHKQNEVSLCTL